ncbi:MAG: protease modulator HflK [Cellvibrionales bacterium]|nr:protease modulator HflK [Cellvibrionales bacterium]
MSQQIEVNIPDLFRKGFVLWILVGLLVVVGFITSMYTVQAESQGVVLRFGKYLKTVEPGLRFKLPFGVDNVYVLPVRRQLKQEYGFGTPGGNNNSQFAESRTRSREKSMMTGDLNAAEVEWIVQYRINDPRLFLFKVMNPESTLRHVSEAVMRTVVGDRTVDEVYKKAPEVTKTRLYWESMKEVVPKMGKKIILDEDASQVLPFLQLNQDGNGGVR